MRGYALLLGVIAIPAPCAAETGTGSLPEDDWSVVRQIGAPPLGTAMDAVRYSATPSLGGQAIIIELRAQGSRAVGSVTIYSGHPSLRTWRRLGSYRLSLSSKRFSKLIGEIDAQLEKGQADHAVDPETGDLIICMDLPQRTTELSYGSKTRWLTGASCGTDDPNGNVAELLGPIVNGRLERMRARWPS